MADASSPVLAPLAPDAQSQPLFPLPAVIVVLMAAYMVASSMWQQPLTSLLALFFVLAAFPIHFLFIRKGVARGDAAAKDGGMGGAAKADDDGETPLLGAQRA